MGKTTGTWKPTLAFARFKAKHKELSQIYWTHQLGADAVRGIVASEDQTKFAVDLVKPRFPRNMLPLSVKQTLEWLDSYPDRVRLHLLVVCSANLESYIKEAAFLYTASFGLLKDPVSLNEVGMAMAAPILARDSLIGPLEYAEKFFEISYGQHLTRWKEAYKLRSAMAHTGGVVTPRTIKELGRPNLKLHSRLTLSWPDLREYLNSADQMATLTDQNIGSKSIFEIEAKRELWYLKETSKLPKKEDLWQYMHNEFGIRLPKESQNKVERMFYK